MRKKSTNLYVNFILFFFHVSDSDEACSNNKYIFVWQKVCFIITYVTHIHMLRY